MKVIAQSLVPTSVPYIHLGYTAASTITGSGPADAGIMLGCGLGTVLLLCTPILVLSAVLGERGRGYRALFRRLRAAVWVAGLGIACLLIAFALVIAANTYLLEGAR